MTVNGLEFVDLILLYEVNKYLLEIFELIVKVSIYQNINSQGFATLQNFQILVQVWVWYNISLMVMLKLLSIIRLIA